jgi:hypothetical protein
MADRIDISAIARVVDQATGPLRKITGGITTAGKAAQTTGGAFFKLNAFKFHGLTAGIRGVGSSLGGLLSQVTRLLGPLTAMAGIAGLGGAVAGMKGYIETADKLAKTARRFGTTAEYLQQFNYVAERSGVDASVAQGALGKFMKTLGTASKGGKAAKDLIPLLSKMGVSMQEIKAGDLASILPKVAAGFEKNVNPVLRNDVALKLFGKSGGALIDMFAQGKISMQELMKEAIRLGVITNADAAEAEKAADAWLDFTKSITGVKNSIFGTLLPAVEPVLKIMKEWVLANKEVIKTEVTAFIRKLGEIIKSINWKGIYEGLKGFVKGMDWVAKKVGGWENVLAALVIYMNKALVLAIANVVKSLALLGVSMVGSIASMTGLTAAFPALGAAIKAFSAALAATPVGWFIAAIVAIGVAAYLIYKYWEPIKKFFVDLWNDPKATFLAAVKWLDDMVEKFVPKGIIDAWDNMADWADELWADIEAHFYGGLEWLSAFAAEFIPQPIQDAWKALGTWFEENWDEIEAAFNDPITWLAEFAGKFIPQPIKDAWGSLTAWFDNLLGGVVGVFQWAWGILEPIISAIGKGVGVITGALGAAGNLVGSAIGGVKDFFTGGGAESAPAAAPADGGSLLRGARRAGVAGGETTAKVEGEVNTNIKIEAIGDIKATATTRDRGMVQSNVEVGRSMPGLAAG